MYLLWRYHSIITRLYFRLLFWSFDIWNIKKKDWKRKKLKNSFLLIIRNMASKEVTTPENKLAEMTINENLKKNFLHNLELKLSLVFGDSIVSCMIRNKGMAFSLETFPLTPEMAKKLLSCVWSYNWVLFLSGLSKLGWCTKNLMESRVFFNKNAKDSDKFKKIQIIEFYWFKQTNNQCQCFHCFCFQKKGELKNVWKWKTCYVWFPISFVSTILIILSWVWKSRAESWTIFTFAKSCIWRNTSGMENI